MIRTDLEAYIESTSGISPDHPFAIQTFPFTATSETGNGSLHR